MKILFIGARLFDDIYYYLREKNIYSILTESNKDAPNLDLSNEYHIVSRGMEEPSKIAILEKVHAIVPLIGIDLPLMDVAIMKEKIQKEHDIPVISPSTDVIAITSSKLKTKEFFKNISINTPFYKTITKNDIDKSLNFPCVLKQNEGQAGKNISVCKNSDEIIKYFKKFEYALYEEFIEGDEISIEVLAYQDDYVALTPIYKGKTTLDGIHPLNKIKYGPYESDLISNKTIKETALKIAKNLKAEAITEIDFIFSKKELKLYAIEINSRPNGTRYLTDATCGVNTLLKLVDMATGDYSSLKINNELKDYYSCEIPIGNFKGILPKEPVKSFKNNSYVVHGPQDYERITLRANSKKKLNNLISTLKLKNNF